MDRVHDNPELERLLGERTPPPVSYGNAVHVMKACVAISQRGMVHSALQNVENCRATISQALGSVAFRRDDCDMELRVTDVRACPPRSESRPFALIPAIDDPSTLSTHQVTFVGHVTLTKEGRVVREWDEPIVSIPFPVIYASVGRGVHPDFIGIFVCKHSIKRVVFTILPRATNVHVVKESSKDNSVSTEYRAVPYHYPRSSNTWSARITDTFKLEVTLAFVKNSDKNPLGGSVSPLPALLRALGHESPLHTPILRYIPEEFLANRGFMRKLKVISPENTKWERATKEQAILGILQWRTCSVSDDLPSGNLHNEADRVKHHFDNEFCMGIDAPVKLLRGVAAALIFAYAKATNMDSFHAIPDKPDGATHRDAQDCNHLIWLALRQKRLNKQAVMALTRSSVVVNQLMLRPVSQTLSTQVAKGDFSTAHNTTPSQNSGGVIGNSQIIKEDPKIFQNKMRLPPFSREGVVPQEPSGDVVGAFCPITTPDGPNVLFNRHKPVATMRSTAFLPQSAQIFLVRAALATLPEAPNSKHDILCNGQVVRTVESILEAYDVLWHAYARGILPYNCSIALDRTAMFVNVSWGFDLTRLVYYNNPETNARLDRLMDECPSNALLLMGIVREKVGVVLCKAAERGITEVLDKPIAIQPTECRKRHVFCEGHTAGLFSFAATQSTDAHDLAVRGLLGTQHTTSEGVIEKPTMDPLANGSFHLPYAQIPLCRPVGLDFVPMKSSGINLFVLVMNLDNKEDQTLMSKSFWERYGRPYWRKTVHYTEEIMSSTWTFGFKDTDHKNAVGRKLNHIGLPKVGQDFVRGEVIIAGVTRSPDPESSSRELRLEVPTNHKAKNNCRVVSVNLSAPASNGTRSVAIVTHEYMSEPNGLKVSVRHAQKGVFKVVSQEDMPWSNDPSMPHVDMVFSPDGVLRRGTMGLPHDALQARIALMTGRIQDTTSYMWGEGIETPDQEAFRKLWAQRCGTDPISDVQIKGVERVSELDYDPLWFRGSDGEELGRAAVYCVHAQIIGKHPDLAKQVSNPHGARIASGDHSNTDRATTGIRFGVQENHALNTHGTAHIEQEIMCGEMTTLVCGNCGGEVTDGNVGPFASERDRQPYCLPCYVDGKKQNIRCIPTTKGARALNNLLPSLGVKMSIYPKSDEMDTHGV